MPRTKVTDVLACFEGDFAEVASAFAGGQYLLWLGSGLSRGVVPDVRGMLHGLLKFLQSRIDVGSPGCRFKRALEEVLELAGVPTGTRSSIDFAQPTETWPHLAEILNSLIDKYAAVLDVSVDGEMEDFLVWSGIDVCQTYGSPTLAPDVEHLCVAILMLEGVVRFAPTANWDGLVEAAMARLTADPDSVLKVVVHPADFVKPQRRAELVKFHGCAVRALGDPATYRELLIARESQIAGWTTKPENKMMKDRLEFFLRSQPALVIGLSAQDANIHTMIYQATQNLLRSWPAAPPSVVFAVQQLGRHHRHMLKATYGGDYASNRHQIDSAALLGAYAKPVLLGLVLYVLADKLCSLMAHVSELKLPAADVERLQADLRSLRDAVGRGAEPDSRGFADAVVTGASLVLAVFRTGSCPNIGSTIYEPLSVAPIAEAVQDPNFPREALGRLALSVALLRRGMVERVWAVSLGSPLKVADGVVRIVTERGQTSRVFFVAGPRALSKLELDGCLDMDDDDVLVICGEALRRPLSRSPRARYGRDGKGAAREVDIESIAAAVDTADELFEAFILEGVL